MKIKMEVCKMKRRYKDPTHPSTTLVEIVRDPEPKTDRFITKCSLCNRPMSFVHEVQGEVVCQTCEEKGRVYLTCVDCGRKFFLSRKNVERYKENGWDMPKRCFHCHQIKKGGVKNA